MSGKYDCLYNSLKIAGNLFLKMPARCIKGTVNKSTRDNFTNLSKYSIVKSSSSGENFELVPFTLKAIHLCQVPRLLTNFSKKISPSKLS